jgi:trbM mating pair formation protein-like protein
MKKTILATALSSLMLAAVPVHAHEEPSMPDAGAEPGIQFLEGDLRTACEVILCLSSRKGLGARECRPPLKRFFKIKFKRPWKTTKARKNFLKLCPMTNDEGQPAQQQDQFLDELMQTANEQEQDTRFDSLMQQAEKEGDDSASGYGSTDTQALLNSAQAEVDELGQDEIEQQTSDQDMQAYPDGSSRTSMGTSAQGQSHATASSDASGTSRPSATGGRRRTGSHTSGGWKQQQASAGTPANTATDRPELDRNDSLSPTPDKPSTKPVQTGTSMCLDAREIEANQGEGDGYISGVNSSWTWSHAGWAGSAKRGYEHQPEWIKSQFGWMRDVPDSKWTLLMPWYAAGTKSGNNSSSQVEIGNMSVQYYSASKKRWIPLGANMKASGGTYASGKSGAGTPEKATGSTVSIPSGQFAHGWFNFVQMPPNDEVQAISVAVQARSRTGSPVLVSAGADYYPNDWQKRNGNAPLMPGVGTGAPRLVGNDWSTVSFTTLSNQTHDGTGISPEELRRSRPHCN